MEEKTQELLIILHEAEKILTDIKILEDEKKLMTQNINSINSILKQLKTNMNKLNQRCDLQEKQLVKLQERIKYIKLDIIEKDIKGLQDLIISNLPNGIKKDANEENGVYKIEMTNNNEYVGTISLYMEEELIADMMFKNSFHNKKIIIKDILRVYGVINYVNMIIGYGDF